MSTDLKELFDAARVATLPASSVDLDDVVRRGRRRRALLVARTSATAGVASVVVAAAGTLAAGHLGGAAAGPVSAGGAGVTTASASPAATDATATALPSPMPTTPPPGKTSSLPPDPQLQNVTLADPAPGFPIRRAPDTVTLTSGLPGTNDARYDATFLVASRDGRQATVMVGAFPMPATSGTPVIGASPGPITDRPTVLGHQAYVTSDGAQTILYFSTGTYTVMATGGAGVTADQLITLCYGLSGLS